MVVTLGVTGGWRSGRERGLSLLELVIGMALIGVVALGFGFLYSTSQRQLIQDSNRASSQSEASFAISHIRTNLYQAYEVTTPAVPVPPVQFTTSDTLVFKTRTDPSNPDKYVESTYRRLGPTPPYILEYRRDGGDIFDPVARSLNVILFTRVDRWTVRVDVTARRGAGSEVNQDTPLVATITPRGIL